MLCDYRPNAVWAGPVSAPPWMPLSAYAADGKPATCSKEPAVQWVWGAVQEDVGILYGPDIAVDAFRFFYRKSVGLDPLVQKRGHANRSLCVCKHARQLQCTSNSALTSLRE